MRDFQARHFSEAPTTLQFACLAATGLLTLALGAVWLAAGSSAGRDSFLQGFVISLVLTEWTATGVLLRRRGDGLRRSRGARLLVAGFGASHLVVGLLQSFDARVWSRDPVQAARLSVVFYALAALMIGVAWQAHAQAAREAAPPRRGRRAGQLTRALRSRSTSSRWMPDPGLARPAAKLPGWSWAPRAARTSASPRRRSSASASA